MVRLANIYSVRAAVVRPPASRGMMTTAVLHRPQPEGEKPEADVQQRDWSEQLAVSMDDPRVQRPPTA